MPARNKDGHVHEMQAGHELAETVVAAAAVREASSLAVVPAFFRPKAIATAGSAALPVSEAHGGLTQPQSMRSSAPKATAAQSPQQRKPRLQHAPSAIVRPGKTPDRNMTCLNYCFIFSLPVDGQVQVTCSHLAQPSANHEAVPCNLPGPT